MEQSSTPVSEAGAVTYRIVNGQPEILLILSKKLPRVRIFPKGHIEAGESAAEAAGRELTEEAGVRGRLVKALGAVTYEFREKLYHVDYYLFEFVETATWGEDGRDPRWYLPDDAVRQLAFDGLRDVLRRSLTGLASR